MVKRADNISYLILHDIKNTNNDISLPQFIKYLYIAIFIRKMKNLNKLFYSLLDAIIIVFTFP